MNKQNLAYKEGSLEYLDQLQKLVVRSYSQFSRVLTPNNWDVFNGILHDREKLAELIERSTCFVCLDNEAVIGMAYLVPSGNPWDVFKTEWSYIRLVGVDPDYRGRGIAKNLTRMCIEYARSNRETTIALHTSEFMDAARNIYESLGFKILHEIEPRFGKKYWLYTLDLKQIIL